MRKNFFSVFLIILLSGIFLSTVKITSVAFAQIKNPVLPDTIGNLDGTTFLQKGVSLVISLLFVGGIIIFFIMLLSGGVRWIASGGDKTHLEGAKGQITHALIGLVILLSAFAIIKLIGALFGIDLLKLSLPTLLK